MSTQIFKTILPSDLLKVLLDKICAKTDKYYTVNNETYKKGLFTNDIQNFMEVCKPYYRISKQKYLDRKLSFNNFTTVLRQICNLNKIKYTSHIKYDKSKYDIVYYVFFF
jgi:hypothetical protein